VRAHRRGGTVSRSFWKQQTGSSEDVRDEHRPIAGNHLAVPHKFNPEAGPTALEISLSWTVRPRASPGDGQVLNQSWHAGIVG
jgi:hypothetical protein